jgi:hypothetical protein
MANIASRVRSENVRVKATHLKLIEPFRFLHPEKKNTHLFQKNTINQSILVPR